MCAVARRDPEIRQKILDATRQIIIEKGISNTFLLDGLVIQAIFGAREIPIEPLVDYLAGTASRGPSQ